jgi:hypothetical protein
MLQIRLFVAVVTALIAGSATTLAGTCPPGYQPITQGTISNNQNTYVNPTLNTPSSSSSITTNTNLGTIASGTSSGGSGAPQNCEPIPTDSNKNRSTGKTPAGTTNKNRGVSGTPTSK